MISNSLRLSFILTLCFFSFQASALFEGSVKCSYDTAISVRAGVTSPIFHQDKFKHCAISCIVANECGALSSTVLGIGKEVYDLIGPGRSEIADVVANFFGIKFQVIGLAKDRDTCESSCIEVFPSLMPKSIL